MCDPAGVEEEPRINFYKHLIPTGSPGFCIWATKIEIFQTLIYFHCGHGLQIRAIVC